MRANDVVIRHIRIKHRRRRRRRSAAAGRPTRSTPSSAHRVIVDHCTFTLGDRREHVGRRARASTGDNVAEWRAGTSRDITFSYNLAAEGLADSSHPKGEHSKGSLVHDNVTNILFYRNVWAHNVERSPLFKGGVHGAIVNNLIYNPGRSARCTTTSWRSSGQTGPYEVGKMSVVGNVMRGGPSTDAGLPFMMLGGDGDVEYYGSDNVAVDKHGNAAADVRALRAHEGEADRGRRSRRPGPRGSRCCPRARSRRTCWRSVGRAPLGPRRRRQPRALLHPRGARRRSSTTRRT